MKPMSTPNVQDFSTLKVDLHTHTNISDGGLTPTELVDRAVNFQVNVLAITDHDTTNGLAMAHQHINDQQLPLHLIDGIEISTSWQGFEIHVVGLSIDKECSTLQALIEQQQQARETRALKIGDKLAKCGFDDIYHQAKTLARHGSITRAHFAKALLNQGKVNNLQAAFDKYIGKGKRAFVAPSWCDIETAVTAIHQSGGVAVLAHPMRYQLSAKWLRRLIVQFKAAGGNAMEIVLPQMNLDQRRNMLNYCLEYDLYASLGSDFHYPSQWSDLGKNLKLPEQVKPVWSLFNDCSNH